MLGKLLGKTLDIVTLPLDVVSIGMDHLCGGDGSKKSRSYGEFSTLEDLRDSISDHLRDLDEK